MRTIKPVTPYPGTPLYRHAIKEGLLKGPSDFYERYQNSDRMTCNFTDVPDDKFYEMISNEENDPKQYGQWKKWNFDNWKSGVE